MKKVMRRQESGVPIVNLLIYLLCSYIITMAILMILALLLFKMKLSEGIVSGVIVFTYIAACFVGGFLAGKKMKKKKYLWGLLMGAAYYLVFLILSMVINKGDIEFSKTILTTFVLCCGGGMMGGMLS